MTCLGQTAAHAASFEVINLNDAGAGSLRDAIATANGAAGADVITFAAGLSGTIMLTTGQLTISDSLQLVGPGSDVLKVDGGRASRVFDISLSPGDVNVTISGLTVSNGMAQTGGGIRVQDESLSLDDVALIDNAALGNGGGLYADGFAASLNVRNSTISGNSARGGGGVYVEDTKGVTVFDGVVIDGNTASEQGGGIFLYDPDADVVINNATITNNVAKKGGGIYLYSQDNGTLTISNSNISGNRATTGGGIYLYDIDHPVSISNSTISGNSATNGGGINIDRISAPAVISNSTISGNTATGSGGGVRLARGGGLTMAHATITNNSAADAGGARFPGPVTLSQVIIAGNTAGSTADLHAAGGVTTDFSIIGAMIGAVTDGGGNQFDVTDPMLTPLTNNGGPTQTHVPLAASPAIDTGNPGALAPATDQRGLPRVVGVIDIGAVETQVTTPAVGLIPDPCIAGKTALAVTGTGGAEYVSLKAADRGRIQVSINNRVVGTYTPTGMIVVDAKGGTDRVVVESEIKLAQLLFGGDGSDAIQSARGRAVIIGGRGDDKLDGYKGRDVIIGGTGVDTLRGRDNDDVLIAGPSTYDDPTTADMVSLCAINAEWARTDASYATRVGRISGTTAAGLNGLSALRAGITVIDDTDKDTLQGDSGTDWYIANRISPGTTLDTLSGRSSSETLTEL